MEITLLLWVRCGKILHVHYFNGDIRYFDNSSVTIKNIESRSISSNGDYTGMIAVYDSLLICWSPRFSNHFFNVYNVDTGEEVGSFCDEGQGTTEAISVNCVFNFLKRGMI